MTSTGCLSNICVQGAFLDNSRNIRERAAQVLSSFIVSIALLVLPSVAQQQPDAGVIPGFQTVEAHEYDSIDLATLGLKLNSPVRSKAGHTPFDFQLIGRAQIQYRTTVGPPPQFLVTHWFLGLPSLFGQEGHIGVPQYSYAATSTATCAGQQTGRYEWAYTDANGTAHPLSIAELWPNSACGATSGSSYTTDGSGIFVSIDRIGSNNYAIDVNGNKITTTSFSDPNGNVISNSGGILTDTLGEPAITRTTSTSLETDMWTDASGNDQSVKLNYDALTLLSSFGCADDQTTPTANAMFPASVAFPDNTSLTYTWETNYSNSAYYTGRLASITLPTGGTISYAYSGGTHGINCADGTPAVMKRTTPDGQWTYTHSVGTTTVTDPQGNNTVYTFVSVAQPPGSALSYSPLWMETQKQVYNGSVTPANLIQTVITCYNNTSSTPSNCNLSGLALPITEKDAYTTYPNVTGYAAVKTAYDTYGRATDVKTFGYNTTAATNEKQIQYGSGNPTTQTCAAISTYIIGKPCSVTLLDSQNGNAILSQTWNSYDSNGNLKQTWNLVSGSGSSGTYLSKQYTYDSHGVVQTTTDVNGQVLNYTTTSCNNMFVTSQFPTNFSNLQTSQTWDCNGGVVTASTDANSQTTHTDFSVGSSADAFYRPLDSKDELGNTTSFSYTPAQQSTPAMTESVFSFNGGASLIDTVSSTDSIGRPNVAQLSQGPGSQNWDTRSRTFDSLGRLYETSLPCKTTAKGTPCSTSTESQTYDALSRPVIHTGTGGDVVTKTYYANDVLTKLTPIPTNENAKMVQKEFDGLGRLKSACLVSTATGSGPCGQANSETGFLTTYSYDAAGRLLQTIQNAQVSSPQQKRTYTYDKLGRLLTETNPESANSSDTALTITYTYDSVTGSPACSTPTGMTLGSNGDLVEKIDPNGNTTCYFYDGLHRNIAITYAGPNSTGVNKYFVYDAATVNSTAMSNAEGRIAEAYTCSGVTLPCSSKITDEGYSYDARGLLSDYYQTSPNSNGYYHLSASHWEDKQVKAVSGVGLPTITFGASDGSGLDGEGRVTKVTASSGTNPVSAVTYNAGSYSTEPIGALLTVTLGLGDSQNFTYDMNTGRMTTYSASVGSSPTVISGTLSWNPNGTLQQLSISDGYNSNDTQTCSYLYDDFARVAGTTGSNPIPGVNCLNGTTKIWNQTFTYGSDSFGNITKSSTGPGASWACTACYDTATNHYNNVLSGSITYDLDGNITNDTFHTYNWLADGHVAAIDSNTVTYDANGNKVEENVGGTIHEYVSAFGINAQMTGQTENATTIDLPGGVQAIYSGGSLQRFRFPDWQGTIRAESNPTTRQFTESLAFAPFGERYAQKGTPFNVDSFTGKPDQIVSDEYDFPARELSDGQGRWVSPDPTRGTGNKYVYADNNPLSEVDPYGLISLSIVMENMEIGTIDSASLMEGARHSESYGVTSTTAGAEVQFLCSNLDCGDPGMDRTLIAFGLAPAPEVETPQAEQPKQASANTTAGQPAAQNIAWSSLSAGQQALVPGGEKAWNEIPTREGMAAAQSNYAAITLALEETKLGNGATGLSEVKSVTEIGPTGIGVTWNAGAAGAFEAAGFASRPGWGHSGESGMIGLPTADGIKGSFFQARGIHVLFNDANNGASGHVHIDYRSGVAHYRSGNDDVRANYSTYKQWFGALPGYNP